MIIDACMVFNELDLLEMRMNELHGIIDHFVVVESEEVFGSTNRKPLYLKEFLKDRKNVTYVSLAYLMPRYSDMASGWERERYQRDAMMKGVKQVAAPEDVVIASDVDEIPRPSAITETIPKLHLGIHRFSLDFYYYNVNWCLGKWAWGTTIGTVRQYDEVGGIHQARSLNYENIVPDAGWHFSYFGGIDKIRNKIESFSHSQDDFCQAFLKRDDTEAAKDIAAGNDIYRTRGLNKFEWKESNDPSLPQTLLNNPQRYKHFIGG